jgi:DNA-binding transcriptional MocR family regulator
LADEEPFAALAPEQTVLVDSLSKRIAPGLTLGFAAAPSHLSERIAVAARSGGWVSAGLPLAAGVQCMGSGTAGKIAAAKRKDAAERQRLVQQCLGGLTIKSDARAYHAWLELPETWRAEAFVAAAAREGIAITPGSAFAVSAGHAPNAVRLALASPSQDALAGALQTLGRLANSSPADIAVE